MLQTRLSANPIVLQHEILKQFTTTVSIAETQLVTLLTFLQHAIDCYTLRYPHSDPDFTTPPKYGRYEGGVFPARVGPVTKGEEGEEGDG